MEEMNRLVAMGLDVGINGCSMKTEEFGYCESSSVGEVADRDGWTLGKSITQDNWQ
jgi:hypothetical protein